ncbi:META domain-containing protein [Kribbella orskensis]|uniref:META domain-containing protein n=2 Tax=Kribbellaceae TaxID=2726069 RepID=A0ABY2BI45_9ACTN|nr:META domain-containing protein [Kribbella sp. VKM Ac-2500]TCO20928.1 META domain-containing protein [Kribbella orskensis]
MIAVAGAGLLLTLAGCGDESSAGGGSLKGRSYLSTAATADGKPMELVANTRIRMQFTDDGRLIADAGCNSMGGKVSTDGGKMSVQDLAITDMGCDAPRHAQDDWLAKLLQDEPAWKLEADKLSVSNGGTELVLQDRETAEPDKPLDGTKWSLETVIAGETASHSVGSERSYLTISGERVTGSTGCNDLQGIVARTGNKLTFGELSVTLKACTGDAAALEKAVLAALKGEVSYSIEANRLKLRTPDGNGIDLTSN